MQIFYTQICLKNNESKISIDNFYNFKEKTGVLQMQQIITFFHLN